MEIPDLYKMALEKGMIPIRVLTFSPDYHFWLMVNPKTSLANFLKEW